MKTIRLVLNVPFMRHPVGTVFELKDSPDISGWDADDRVREKQDFSGQRSYRLPDGGRGQAVELPESHTHVCPPTAFDGVRLDTGPCRVTGVQSGLGERLTPIDGPLACGKLREEDATLVPINGIPSQALCVRLPETGSRPRGVLLRDRLRGLDLRTFPQFDRESNFDFSALSPGFYELLFQYPDECRHSLRFIKTFPLLITLEPGSSRFTTQPTRY